MIVEHGSKPTYWVFELRVDLRNDLAHLLQLRKHVFLGCAASEHRLHLIVSGS